MQMKHPVAAVLCLLLCLSFLFLDPIRACAEAPTPPSMEEASAVYFYHLQSDRVVSQKNADQQVSAGSSVKLMSGLLFCEQLKDLRQEYVTVTGSMVNQVTGRRLYLKSGDVLTVEQLLYASVCGSYNDAFYVLAHAVSGSLSAFVDLMNQRAASLGLSSTFYTDPSGINDGSLTSARDVATVALTAYQNPLFLQLCGTAKFQMPKTQAYAARTLSNRNEMIVATTTSKYYNKHCIGMSAGSTSNGGNCVIALTKNGEETYLCVVLGAMETADTEYGYVVANRLLAWAEQTYSYVEVITPETVLCTLPVTVSDTTSEVEIRTKESLLAYLPTGVTVGKEIRYSIRLLYDELEAPVTEGTPVGYIAVIYEERTLGTLELYTASGAQRSNLVSSLKAIQNLTQTRAALAAILFFSVSLVAWITTETVLRVRRRHRWDRYFSGKVELPPDLLKKRKK